MDSTEQLIEETPMPKAADELFDDFVFNFAANRKLQKSRFIYLAQISGIKYLSISYSSTFFSRSKSDLILYFF